jgi:hypothetical protein
MPILFYIGSSFTNTLYKSVLAGRTIPGDIIARPFLALTMLAGMAAGITAFFLGFKTLIKKSEKAFLVYASTAIGGLLILYLAAEVAFPH